MADFAHFMPLQEAIESAFADVPYPGDKNITRCPYHCRPCEEVAEFFKGKTARDISIEDLRDHHIALSLFTPEAFQFFLPAFMLASLNANDQINLLPDAIRTHFEFNIDHRDHFLIRLNRFTEPQRKVIVDFLRHMESKGAGSAEDVIGLLGENDSRA